MIFVIIVCACSASFIIYSPDELLTAVNTDSIGEFNYGNPSFYPILGKLVFVTITSCQVNERLDGSSFAIINYADRGNCKYQEISLSVQNQKGIGTIFINNDDDVGGIWIPTNDEGADQVYICTILIGMSLGELLRKHSDKEIWASYEYEISSSASPKLVYYLTGNYTKDNEFFTSLQNLNNKDLISRSLFEVGLLYIRSYAPNPQVSEDCIDSYCMLSGNGIAGSEKLLNTAIALNFYQELSTVTEIINFFKEIYLKCSADYSQNCIGKVVKDYGGTPNESTSVFNQKYISDAIEYILFSIGNNILFWSEFLESGYCLSQNTPSPTCPKCSEQCTYDDIHDSVCTTGCNTSSCGYDYLKCLEKDNCFAFMLDDGNCNGLCTDDPDCPASVNLVAIIVPVIIGIIVITLVFVSIFICYKKKKLCFSTKIPPIHDPALFNEIVFRQNVHPRSTICIIDLKGFQDGEQALIFPQCQHLIHLNCKAEWERTYPSRCPSCFRISADLKQENLVHGDKIEENKEADGNKKIFEEKIEQKILFNGQTD